MRWYTYLKSNDQENKKEKALLECEILEDTNLVVAHKMIFMQFGRFNSYLDFAKYMIHNTIPEQRCFYEMIFGNKSQRIYFDIEFFTRQETSDIQNIVPENEADESIRVLCQCILEELKNILQTENPLRLNESHILVFTSHKDHKKSYHIVVEGFCVNNFKENKEFHDRVVKRFPSQWHHIIDHSMYKSLQQFRIVGNTKYENNRYKVLNEELTLSPYGNGWIPKVEPDSDNHKLILLLESSLISHILSCIMLPSIIDEEKEVTYRNRNSPTTTHSPLSSQDIRKAIELCYKYAGLEYGDPRFPYSYLSTVEDNGISSLILMKRLRPSTCAICNRVHEHENPYLIICGDNRDVYLDCRRNADNKKLYVGSLGGNPVIESVETPVKTPIEPPKNTFNVKEFIKSGAKYVSTKSTETKDKPTQSLVFKFNKK